MSKTDLDAILERIQLLMNKECDGSISEMARQVKHIQPSVSNWMTGRTQLNMLFIKSILERWPNLSAEWLLRGEGEMFKSKGVIEKTLTTINKFIPSCGADNYYESLLDMRDKRIRELEREVAMLRSGQTEDIRRNA